MGKEIEGICPNCGYEIWEEQSWIVAWGNKYHTDCLKAYESVNFK